MKWGEMKDKNDSGFVYFNFSNMKKFYDPCLKED